MRQAVYLRPWTSKNVQLEGVNPSIRRQIGGSFDARPWAAFFYNLQASLDLNPRPVRLDSWMRAVVANRHGDAEKLRT
jgi:hypothetical protein